MESLLVSSQDNASPATDPTARVRILETTDLHMQLLGYDYFADHPTPDLGLVPLACVIETYRADPYATTFLFDNGDFLQGNPLAEHAIYDAPSDMPNPMITAFNALSYDAVALGNHEFNYGIDVLNRVITDAAFPVVCANITQTDGTPVAPPYAIIEKGVMCSDGQSRPIKVGVFGVVTPQILRWDKAILDGKLTAQDIVQAADRCTRQMRDAGADIIVALCHSGIGAEEWSSHMENAAITLAALPEVDVVLLGHTHDQFPDPRAQNTRIVDHDKGTIHGKPSVMAGFYGSHLDVIALDLTWSKNGWRIAQSKSKLHPPNPTCNTALQRSLTQAVDQAHQATREQIKQPIATSRVSLNSHFSTTAPDLTLELLADAQINHMQRASLGTSWQDIPVLAVAAPFRVGGRGGPNHFIDIAAGPMTLRDAAAFYPFTNTLYGVRRSGAQIKTWLEKVALYFNKIRPNETAQPLINPDIPPYDFDVIYGLTYAFDLSRNHNRVVYLCHNGVPVADTDQFIVATNSYRANGGGNFFVSEPDDIAYVSVDTTRNILIDCMRKIQVLDRVPREVWRFAPIEGAAAWFTSNAAARPPVGRNIRPSGKTRDGFGIFTLTF